MLVEPVPLDPRRVWGIPSDLWPFVDAYASGLGLSIETACRHVAMVMAAPERL